LEDKSNAARLRGSIKSDWNNDNVKTVITISGISVKNFPKVPGSSVKGQKATIVVIVEKITGTAILCVPFTAA
jgi:hypothetical protein